MTSTFFAQPAVEREDLLRVVFFLLNQGNGYTDVGVNQMTMDLVLWHADALKKKITDENEARKKAHADAKSAQQRIARR